MAIWLQGGVFLEILLFQSRFIPERIGNSERMRQMLTLFHIAPIDGFLSSSKIDIFLKFCYVELYQVYNYCKWEFSTYILPRRCCELLLYTDRRYFQRAHFIPIVGVGKRGAY